MYTTDHPPTKPPAAPPLPEARIACPDCGAPTRRAWRRGHDGVFRAFAVCSNCGGLVCALRDRPRDQDEREQLVTAAAENYDLICENAVTGQRDLLARAYGPAGPLPLARARAVYGLTVAILAMLSDEHTDAQEAKLAQQSRGQTARYRGWYRPPGRRQKWEPLVSGQTEDETLAALLNAAPGGDKVVLAADRDPNKEGRPR